MSPATMIDSTGVLPQNHLKATIKPPYRRPRRPINVTPVETYDLARLEIDCIEANNKKDSQKELLTKRFERKRNVTATKIYSAKRECLACELRFDSKMAFKPMIFHSGKKTILSLEKNQSMSDSNVQLLALRTPECRSKGIPSSYNQYPVPVLLKQNLGKERFSLLANKGCCSRTSISYATNYIPGVCTARLDKSTLSHFSIQCSSIRIKSSDENVKQLYPKLPLLRQ